MTALSPNAAHAVATQVDPRAVLQAAVELVRERFPGCVAFAALQDGSIFPITATSGTYDPRFEHMSVGDGMGLGGYVLDRGEGASVDDYPHDPRISRDFVHIVSEGEGLLGMSCVPIFVRQRPQGLLYASRRSLGCEGDRAISELEEIARFAAIGIQQAQERRNTLELERLRDRERLATMLHDSVAQMLFGIGVAAQRSLTDGDPVVLEEAMREIETTAASARRELRDTLHRLAESDDGLALESRLEAEVRLFATQTGCNARVAWSGSPRRLPDLAEELVVDVALEGLRNAVKHASATFALVCLDFEPRRVHLSVQSEVHGPAKVIVPSTGMGIAQLAERARRVGGRVDLVPGEDGSQVLRLELQQSGL